MCRRRQSRNTAHDCPRLSQPWHFQQVMKSPGVTRIPEPVCAGAFRLSSAAGPGGHFQDEARSPSPTPTQLGPGCVCTAGVPKKNDL